MQKKFIALAVAGLVSGAAFAQSNVTVYGVADAAFEFTSVPGSTNSAKGENNNTGTYTRVSSNSSYVGFKGTEALGNGLNGIFQIETAVSLDGGGFGSGRDTFVGLSSDKMGTVKLGLQTGPSRALGAGVDLNVAGSSAAANNALIGKIGGLNAVALGSQFANSPLPGPAVSTLNGGTNSAGVFDTRLANAISYTSPSFSGLNLIAAYSATENRTTDGTPSTAQLNPQAYDLGAIYNNGPIFAGLTYGSLNQDRNGNYTGLNKTSLLRLAGAYTFTGGHKISALVEQDKAKVGVTSFTGIGFATSNNSYDVNQTTWGLGGKFMATPNVALIAQYYQAQNASGSGSASDTGAQQLTLASEYSLSKRTMLRAYYSQINNKSNVAYNFGNNPVNNVSAGGDPRILGAGIRHTF